VTRQGKLPEDWYFYNLSADEIWHRYCGFIDLSIEQFMTIQERLLTEQIGMVHNSFLGRKIMGERTPRNVEEFRQTVPLTTYQDYEPYLSEQREDVLPEKPYLWVHTSGRSGRFKWTPYTERALEVTSRHALGGLMFAAASRQGEVNLHPGVRMLLLVAPRPYVTGAIVHYISTHRFSGRVMPPLAEADAMEFRDRVMLGFEMALREGVDQVFTIASVLAKVGEVMTSQARQMRLSSSMARPAVLGRVASAWFRAKRGGRGILPGDLWRLKGIVTGGTDTYIYKNDIAHYWGQAPYEVYAATECFPMAMASWNKKWLTFVPNLAFWEFIPEAERRKSQQDPTYRPKTVRLNEVEQGQDYEVVLTHYHGMPFMRYRMGDVVRVAGMGDEETGSTLPQFAFKCRTGDIIMLYSLTELDEKTVWQAIINTGAKVAEWSAAKEIENDQAYLRLYIELKEGADQGDLEKAVDQQLRAIDVDYRDIGDQLGLQPVRVTYLPPGTFQRYYEEMRKEGADLAHLKPPHMNPSDDVIEKLFRLGGHWQT